jgi:hypothetical protein
MTATYDLLSPALFAEPYPTFDLMRQSDPLYWHEFSATSPALGDLLGRPATPLSSFLEGVAAAH